MKEFIINVNTGYYLWAEFLVQLYQRTVSSSAEFRTAPTVRQADSHVLSLHSNILM